MKKFFTAVISILFIILSFCSCAYTSVPPSMSPSISCGGIALKSYAVLAYKGESELIEDLENNVTPQSIIAERGNLIPYTAINDGKLDLIAGIEKNNSSVKYSMRLLGIYRPNGEKTSYEEEEFLFLPNGKYIVCTESVRVEKSQTEIRYLFAGIIKGEEAEGAFSDV